MHRKSENLACPSPDGENDGGTAVKYSFILIVASCIRVSTS